MNHCRENALPVVFSERLCYTRPVASHRRRAPRVPRSTRPRVALGAKQRRARSRRTSRPVRLAAARAVEQVLASSHAFKLLIARLEAAGWHVERDHPDSALAADEPARLTPPARAR